MRSPFQLLMWLANRESSTATGRDLPAMLWRGSLHNMPGTPTNCGQSTRQRLLRAATLLAVTCALPSCIVTTSVWNHRPPRTKFETDRLAAFPIGPDHPSTPATGSEALAVRLPESARRWLTEQGIEGGSEWLILRPVIQEDDPTQRIVWPSTRELAIWLVQYGGDPKLRWRVGELQGAPTRIVGTDCSAAFLPEPPPHLEPELPGARLSHVSISDRSPLAERIALTPLTLTADAAVITWAAAAAVVGAGAYVVASPVLLVNHLCSSDD